MADIDKRDMYDALYNAMRDFNSEYGSSAFGTGSRGGGGGDAASRERETRATNQAIADLQKLASQSKATTQSLREEEKAREDAEYELEREIKFREKNNIALDEQLSQYKREKEARDARLDQERTLKESIKKVNEAFSSLTSAVLNTEKGFTKYGKSIEEAGGAVGSFVGKFGPWGKALEFAIKGVTTLNVAILKQTDALLKQSDDLAKAGAAGTLATKEIQQLANQAGYTTKNMEGLFKASKSLGTDVLALGNSVTDGTRAFAKIAERNDDVLAGFRKLGFSQEEFTQAQANSIKLMVQQGQVITKEMRDRGELVKISKSYAENLTVMSALTGQTREQMEKRLEQENAAYNVQVKQAEMSVKIMDLEKSLQGKSGAEREEIQKTIDTLKGMQTSFTNAQAEVSEFLSPDQLKAFKEISTTGTITSQSGAALNQQLGGRGIELVTALTEAKDKDAYDRAMARLQSQLGQGAISATRNFGTVARFDEEGGRALGVTERLSKQVSMFGNKTEEEILRARREQRAAVGTTLQGGGAVGQDPAQQMRATVETFERSIQILVDKTVGAFNPFTNGLTGATAVLGGFTLALGAATVALGAKGLAGMLGSGAKAAGAVGAAKTAGALGTAAAGTAAAGTAAAGAAGVLAAGGIGYGIGTLLNDYIINPAVSGLTGKKDNTLGGWLYDVFNSDKNVPGAASGGILSGPKSGFPAILHGTEAVIPLNGKKIPIEFTGTGIGSPETREQRDLQEKGVKGIIDNNFHLTKLITSLFSLEKTIKKQVDEQEDLESELQSLQTGRSEEGGIRNYVENAIDRLKQAAGIGGTGRPSGGYSSSPANYQPTSDMAGYLQKVAMVESGGQSGAKASTSSASGLFQFTKGTWEQTVKQMGKDYTLNDRFDPMKSAEVAAFFTQQQRAQLEKGTGRKANDVDLYMAHFLGAGGASRFLNSMQRDPNAPASMGADPSAIRANQSIFFDRKTGRERSLTEVYNLMGKKLSNAEQMIAGGRATQDVMNLASGTPSPQMAIARPDFSAPSAKTATAMPASTVPTTAVASTVDTETGILATFSKIISDKFDEMLDKMNEANDIAGQQLRAART